MLPHNWSIYALVCILVCQIFAAPLVKRQAELVDAQFLNPEVQDIEAIDDNAREKRKIPFELKSSLLGAVFGKINSFIDSKTSWINQLDQQNIEKNKAYGIEAPKNTGLGSLTGVFSSAKAGIGLSGTKVVSTTQKGPTTTDDTPDFDRKRVSLEIPDQLFGSTFTMVTNISKIIGSVIMGTAERTQTLVEAMKPFLGKFFLTKGLNVSTNAKGSAANKL